MNILTFDIEEWFHINNSDWIAIDEWPNLEKRIEANTNIILTFLKRHNIKASFFVLGWVAEHYPALVKQIAKDGHDIGYHSYYHRLPKNQTKKEFEHDLINGLTLLEKITSKKIVYYRAPNFSLKNKWMLDCLVDNGIQVSSSIKNPIKHKGNNLPNKPFIFARGNSSLLEFPLVTKDILISKFAYSGSGYFRILPLRIIKELLIKKQYQMLYFHPNDFDHDVPTKKKLGFVRNTLNTIRTATTLPKLEQLTNHFSFISISQALEQLNEGDMERIVY